MNSSFRGKVIPNNVPTRDAGGEGIFFKSESRMTGAGFAASDLKPADQIWFKNPFYHYMPPLVEDEPAQSAGEEGSNVFYLGNGIVVSIYSKQPLTIENYQRGMLEQWNTVRHWPSVRPGAAAPTVRDFAIRRVRRPVPPKEFYEKITERR
jgi:hypothetical protein